MKAGFAIIPCEEQMTALVNLQSKFFKSADLYPRFGQGNPLPHLTLIQGDFSSSTNFQLICNDLQGVFHNYPNSSMPFKTITIERPGWLFLMLSKTVGLVNLHSQAFLLTRNLLQKPQLDDKNFDGYSELEITNYKNWGYRYIGDAFLPHVTLGKILANQSALSDLVLRGGFSEFSKTSPRFLPFAITAYKMGEFGSHQETLAIAPL